MGQYDYDYCIPEDFLKMCFQYLVQSNNEDIAQLINRIEFSYDDLGFAHYVGLKGDTWNKHAIDISIVGTEIDISLIKSKRSSFENAVSKALKPSVSGLLPRDFYYLVSNNDIEIELPKAEGESFDTLSKDIYDALAKDEPALVLDRLHTYSIKYIREICDKHGIAVKDTSGNYYPLHSLAGMLRKHYESNEVFQSDFTAQAVKMSFSIFEKFSSIRNDQSYAHDNMVLNKMEAAYVIRVVVATLTLIKEIEQ